MSAWKCRRCGAEFDIPRRIVNGGGDIGEDDTVCPSCGSAEYEEACECAVCHRTMFCDEVVSGCVCCDCFREKSENVPAVLKYVKDRELEEDFYIRAIFDNDKTLLYNTLKEAFLKWPKEQQEHFAKGFADDDKDDYADWLRDQED